jgi:hypothetical protein
MNPMAILGLLKMADKETLELFKRFVAAAQAAPDLNTYLKRAFRKALGDDVEYVVETPIYKDGAQATKKRSVTGR